MTKRLAFRWTFLAVTTAAVGMELWAANDKSADTEPWTYLIATCVPQAVTIAAITWLTSWLGPHFEHAYRTRKKTTVADAVSVPPTPAGKSELEPLVARAAAVALGGALITLVVAFGIPITNSQREAILAVLGIAASILAPLITAWWARRHVWAPRTVARKVAQVQAECAAPGGSRLVDPPPAGFGTGVAQMPLRPAVPPDEPDLG